MIKNKIIVFIMLFSVGILFTNEIYIQYLSYIDTNYYYVSFYPKYGQEEKMLQDVEQVAKENDLDVFFVCEETKSNRNQRFEIYSSEATREYLEQKEQIFENEHSSLFTGSVTVIYKPYYELDADTIHKYPEGFRLIGEYEDMYRFKQLLIDEYAGGFPHFDGYNSLEDIQGMVRMVWAVVILVVLLVEYYLVSVERKEIFVRFTMGESLTKILGLCIGRDSLLLLAVMFLVMTINYLISGGIFEAWTVMCATFIIILVIAMFYLKLLWYDVSEIFSNRKISKETIMGNYAVKAFVLVLIICISASNIVAITQWLQYDKQGELFEKQKGTKHIQFYHRDDLCENCSLSKEIDGSEFLEYLLYIKYEREEKANSVYKYTDELGLTNADEYTELVYISCYGEEYLKEKLPEINEYREDTLYIIAPESAQCTKEDQKDLFLWFSDDVGKNSEQYEKVFIEYKKDLKITSLAGECNLGSEIVTNPIIAFESIKDKSKPTLTEIVDYGLMGAYGESFIDISSDEVDAFLKEIGMCGGMRYHMEDVWENYSVTLTALRRLAIISIAIIVMMLSLFVFVNQTFLKMLYNGNGIELAIKKVSGYSMFERFKTIIIADCITGIVAVSVACVVCGILELCNLTHVIIIGVLCIAIDLMLIIYNCHKMDKERIQKILKGGCL